MLRGFPNLYGFSAAFGFLLGSFVVWKKIKEEGFSEEKIFDGIIFTSLFALFGARINFILLNFKFLGFNLLKWIWLTKYAGLRFNGGLIFGALGVFLFTRKEKWDFWSTVDMAVFGASLFQAVAALGFSFADVLLSALTFYFLLKLERRYRLFAWYKGKKDKAAEGFLALFYLIFYNSGRVFLEKIQGNGIYLNGLFVLIGLVLLYKRSGREISEDGKLISGCFLLIINKLKYKVKTLKRKKGAVKRIKAGEDIK